MCGRLELSVRVECRLRIGGGECCAFVKVSSAMYALNSSGPRTAGSGDRLWHSASIFSLKLRWNLVASAECDSSATSIHLSANE